MSAHDSLADGVSGAAIVVSTVTAVDADAAGFKSLIEADVEQIIFFNPDPG